MRLNPSGTIVALTCMRDSFKSSAGRESSARCGDRDRNREFAAKLQIVCEEADESVLWLKWPRRRCPIHLKPKTDTLLAEAKELRAIFSKARSTFRDGCDQRRRMLSHSFTK
jgi:hypothetical protein